MNIQEKRLPLSDEDIRELRGLFIDLFHVDPSDAFADKIHSKKDLLLLVAYEGEKAIGFKMCYERYFNVCFSWLGGVLEGYRRKGVASALMNHQHQWCKENGYEEIQTETLGSEPAMLILNAQQGFEVYGTYLGNDGKLRVQMRKFLDES